MKKILIRVLLVIGIILAIGGIGYLSYGIYQACTLDIPNPVATIEIEDYGTVKVELYPDMAPNTVTNFIRLANRGFYNGLTFHRTMPNFVIQGGAKENDTTANPTLSDIMDNVGTDKAYNIKGEFIANGYTKNTLKHEKGVISMARGDYSQYSSTLTTQSYNSAGSQFFIMTENNTNLDGLYTGFGKVTEGMDVVEKVANVEVHYRTADLKEGEKAPKDEEGNEIASDTPKKKPVIKSISVETYGVDYGVPETIDVFDAYGWLMQQYGLTQ